MCDLCRSVVMLRSTLWRFKKVVLMNTCPLLVQKGKLLIHIHKRLRKLVSKWQNWAQSLFYNIVPMQNWSSLLYSTAPTAPVLSNVITSFQTSPAAAHTDPESMRNDPSTVVKNSVETCSLSCVGKGKESVWVDIRNSRSGGVGIVSIGSS